MNNSSSSTIQAKYCQYCGKEMSTDANFCLNCGKPIGPQIPLTPPKVPIVPPIQKRPSFKDMTTGEKISLIGFVLLVLSSLLGEWFILYWDGEIASDLMVLFGISTWGNAALSFIVGAVGLAVIYLGGRRARILSTAVAGALMLSLNLLWCVMIQRSSLGVPLYEIGTYGLGFYISTLGAIFTLFSAFAIIRHKTITTELKAPVSTKVCPNCRGNLASYPSDIRHCPYCGYVLLWYGKHCVYCGSEMASDGIFCPNCRKQQPEVRTLTPSIPAKPESNIGRNIIIAIALIFTLLIVAAAGYGVYEATKPTPTIPTPYSYTYPNTHAYTNSHTNTHSYAYSDTFHT